MNAFENMTTEQQLGGECERLDARFAVDDAAGLTTDQLITRYIARKMHQFGVTDAELRRTVTTLVSRRFGDLFTCCQQVCNGKKLSGRVDAARAPCRS